MCLREPGRVGREGGRGGSAGFEEGVAGEGDRDEQEDGVREFAEDGSEGGGALAQRVVGLGEVQRRGGEGPDAGRVAHNRAAAESGPGPANPVQQSESPGGHHQKVRTLHAPPTPHSRPLPKPQHSLSRIHHSPPSALHSPLGSLLANLRPSSLLPRLLPPIPISTTPCSLQRQVPHRQKLSS